MGPCDELGVLNDYLLPESQQNTAFFFLGTISIDSLISTKADGLADRGAAI